MYENQGEPAIVAEAAAHAFSTVWPVKYSTESPMRATYLNIMTQLAGDLVEGINDYSGQQRFGTHVEKLQVLKVQVTGESRDVAFNAWELTPPLQPPLGSESASATMPLDERY